MRIPESPVDEESERHSPPPHISVGRVGRAILGSCAFLTALCLGAYAGLLAIVIAPRVVGQWKLLSVHLLLDLCAIASIFMLLLAISFWAGGSRWTDPLLCRLMPKGVVAVCVLVATIFVAVGIEFVTVGIDEPVLGITLVVLFVIIFPIIVIALTRKSRRDADAQEVKHL